MLSTCRCHSIGDCLCLILPYTTHTHWSELLCIYYRLDGAAQLITYVSSHAELQDLHSLGDEVHGRLHFVPLLSGREVEAPPHPVKELQDPHAERKQQELILTQLGWRGQLAGGADLQDRGHVAAEPPELGTGLPAPWDSSLWRRSCHAPCPHGS